MPEERRTLRLGTIALTAALACTTLPARAESVLRVRLNSDIASTNPGVRRDENTDALLMHVVEGLVAYREDASVGPLLAERWEVSADGKAYTFRLRPGLKFHNGAPLTASDVVWSFERYLDPKTSWRCRKEFSGGGFAKILSVKALDPLSVRIVLDRASPGFLASLARVDCGETAILHRSSVGPGGAWRWPVGTGPFRLTAWKRNQYVELARFAGYRPAPGPRDGNTGGKQALVDKVRFLVVPDAMAAEAALLRGDLDILDGVQPIDLRQLRRRSDIRLDVHPSMDIYALLFQTRDPALADPRLRRGLALALDVPGMARAVTQGTAAPNRAIVPAPSAFHRGIEARIDPPDLTEARRLVRASGYRGQPIALITNHRYPAMFDCAVLIQAMARQVGVNLRIETLDWAAQLDRYGAGRYQAMAFAYSARMDPSLSLESMIGDKHADPRKVWDDPQARALLARSRATADSAERQVAFDSLQRLLLDQAPAVVLFNSARIAAIRANVVGYQGWSAAQPRYWGVSLR